MSDMLDRRHTTQTIAWFRDLYKRDLLELDPPYQRRSVWNQKYRDFFVETVLLNYPVPQVFIHEEIGPDGTTRYSVVDGKQRLTTVFDFADDVFPVRDDSVLGRFEGEFFSRLSDDIKQGFWKYQIPVEFIPTSDEGLLNSIFERINKNVARLTRQELRHAKYDGEFASAVDDATSTLNEELPDIPRIARTSLRQMKDVEFVAQLLLLVESGPASFSQDELDQVYSDRDEEWEDRRPVDKRYRHTISAIKPYLSHDALSQVAFRRIRNQADFYSLFGAFLALEGGKQLPDVEKGVTFLNDFFGEVANAQQGESDDPEANSYYTAARSASNDLRQRLTRIRILTDVLAGKRK